MRNRLPIVLAGLLLVGALLCPKPVRPNKVDAGALFVRVMEAELKSLPRALPPAKILRMRDLIERNYTFSVAGEDFVAGRAAWVLAIRPRIKGRP